MSLRRTGLWENHPWTYIQHNILEHCHRRKLFYDRCKVSADQAARTAWDQLCYSIGWLLYASPNFANCSPFKVDTALHRILKLQMFTLWFVGLEGYAMHCDEISAIKQDGSDPFVVIYYCKTRYPARTSCDIIRTKPTSNPKGSITGTSGITGSWPGRGRCFARFPLMENWAGRADGSSTRVISDNPRLSSYHQDAGTNRRWIKVERTLWAERWRLAVALIDGIRRRACFVN